MEKIFMDGEFCDLENSVELLSIALIKETGEELYIEICRSRSLLSDWVEKNVLPNLTGEKKKCPHCGGKGFNIHGREGWQLPCYECEKTGFIKFGKTEDIAKKKIINFIDGKKYQMVSDVNQFDWQGWCALMGGVFSQPLHYIPLDLATALHVKGYDCDINREDLLKEFNIKIGGKKHNALYDARQCKALWDAIN